jgi:Leucine-rich repeat (LRR) protein
VIVPELHVDHQQLSPHENLVFDPRSCLALSNSLESLNASDNRMLSLQPLHELRRLTTLDVGGNLLAEVEGPDVVGVLARMSALRQVDLRNNPLTRTIRHWEAVLGACQHLTWLNGKEVQDNSRIMIKKLRAKRSKDVMSS